MRKFTLFAVVLGLLVAGIGHAQVPGAISYPLAVAWDVDGEAADADQVLAAAVLADSTDYTAGIAAQPDVCRKVDITIVDNAVGIEAGTITVSGLDCWGDPLTTTWSAWTAGDDDGVKTLVVGTVSASGRTNLATAAYFSSVTAITTGVLTGDTGAETVAVGYTSNSEYGYSLYGRRVDLPVPPYRYVDIRSQFERKIRVINGAAFTDVTALTAGTNPFDDVAVNDLVSFNLDGAARWYRVVTRADADTITVDVPVDLPATGLAFFYKKRYLSTDTGDGWLGVRGYDALQFLWQEYTLGVNTGGLVSNVECATTTTNPLPAIQVDSDTIATGTVGVASTSIDLRTAPFEICRLGIKFGTGDDADATPVESVYANVTFRN